MWVLTALNWRLFAGHPVMLIQSCIGCALVPGIVVMAAALWISLRAATDKGSDSEWSAQMGELQLLADVTDTEHSINVRRFRKV